MKDNENILKTFLIGVIFFTFIESFYNLMIDVNAYVFMNLSEIMSILPILVIILIIIAIIVMSFNTKKIIKHQYRLFLIVLLISILRIIVQFMILTPFLLLFNFLILFSGMIFFNETIYWIQTKKDFLNINLLVAGIILGLGIQFIFLIINISSNLTNDFIKLIPVIFLIVATNIVNIIFLFPENLGLLTEKEEIEKPTKEISYIHFFILGALFLVSVIWMVNPMALSAYGIINFNFLDTNLYFPWFGYGFTYYIIIIFLVGIVSFYGTTEYLLKFSKNHLKTFSLLLGLLFILMNGLSLLFLGKTRSILATIFFTSATIFNVFFLIYYISYIFNFYRFDSRPKLLVGLILFFITILAFILIQVEILWYEYVSLLINIIILVGTGAVLISIIESINFSKLMKRKELTFKLNRKSSGILFLGVLILSGVSFIIITTQRVKVNPGAEDPTFMTWNIHNAIGVDDSFNLDRLINDIKNEDPDVLGLNEVDMGALKTSFVDIATYFAHKLNMYYYYGYSFYKHYGNALLSKYPILEAEIIELPLIVASAEPRSLIKAKIEINSSLWTIYITHLSTKSADRLAQVPFIVNQINQEAFERIVWMGDFNFEPADTEYGLINSTTTLNFTDTYSYLNSDLGYTGNFDDNFVPQKRIDYIMCSPDLTPILSDVSCSIASDHCAVITKF